MFFSSLWSKHTVPASSFIPRTVNLGFLLPVMSEPSKTSCPPYTLKWTLCQKKTRLHKLTGNAVQNIISYPSIFWDDKLESEIADVVAQKRLANTHEAEETQLVCSINARGEEAIPGRFPGSDVNWADVDEQIAIHAYMHGSCVSLPHSVSIMYSRRRDGRPVLFGGGRVRPKRRMVERILRTARSLHCTF
ncbi:uncharacterized protein F5Z01DRAFT_171953 [Emericellopsis atlantica]|uniref:Uncharacterized protein n=1 Tax=Emericellopsis atlantica TaxID=2614577 RepID=A0A9P8CN25_9HYPO|nr:uncharacterized protein F5Z01DRAFT_171953 [Emericellopsis atlantica]KAG9253048.1 hypothetical protein F5Z01DRAFT_171953 [Emericellopsis atlantica]